MCQLLALNSDTPSAINFAFTGFSARGGRTGEHVDGFGVGFHDGRQGAQVVLDEAPAASSPVADFLRRQPIRATTTLAHIRKATQGAVQRSNCHPFLRQWRGRQWLFCHNGHLKDFDPALDAAHQPVGSTDSERAFCWLLQELERRLPATSGRPGQRAPAWPQLAPVLAELAAELACHGTFNFLLSDGHALYAHCSTRLHWLARGKAGHPFQRVRLVDADLAMDLHRANHPDDRMTLVATEPLTHDEPWQAMTPGSLWVFAKGRPVWRRVGAAQPSSRSEAAVFNGRRLAV